MASMLKNIETRLAAIRATGSCLGKAEDCLVPGVSQQGPSGPADELVNNWITMRAMRSPIITAGSARQSLQLALSTGVPRGIETLSLPGPVGRLIVAAILSEGHVVACLASSVANLPDVEVTGDDVVATAIALQDSSWARSPGKAGYELPGLFKQVLSAARIVEAMASTPCKLEGLEWDWTLPLHRFFAARGYRGIRRRAARRWGLSGEDWVGDARGFRVRGYSAFTVEWLLAGCRSKSPGSCVRSRQMIAKIEVEIRRARFDDLADWLKEDSGKPMKFMKRGA